MSSGGYHTRDNTRSGELGSGMDAGAGGAMESRGLGEADGVGSVCLF